MLESYIVLLHLGTEPLRSCLGRLPTALLLTCGLLAASWLNSTHSDLFFLEIVKWTRSLRFAKSWARWKRWEERGGGAGLCCSSMFKKNVKISGIGWEYRSNSGQGCSAHSRITSSDRWRCQGQRLKHLTNNRLWFTSLFPTPSTNYWSFEIFKYISTSLSTYLSQLCKNH